MIGNRYHDSRVINAGMLQQNVILRKVCAAIADEKKRHHLDTVAAIDNLFMSTVRTISHSLDKDRLIYRRPPRSASPNPV